MLHSQIARLFFFYYFFFFGNCRDFERAFPHPFTFPQCHVAAALLQAHPARKRRQFCALHLQLLLDAIAPLPSQHRPLAQRHATR